MRFSELQDVNHLFISQEDNRSDNDDKRRKARLAVTLSVGSSSNSRKRAAPLARAAQPQNRYRICRDIWTCEVNPKPYGLLLALCAAYD